MAITTSKVAMRTRRHARIRAKIAGTGARPRLAVFRSNRAIYAQLINDEAGTTIVASDSRAMKGASAHDRAKEVGKQIAEKAKAKGITEAVFDRGGFQYQGSIVSLAEGAREGGLTF